MADDVDPDLRSGRRNLYTRQVEQARRARNGIGSASRELVTQPGGSGPPSVPGGRSVAAPEGPERRAVVPRSEGAVVPRGEGAVSAPRVIDGDPPRVMRDVPNIQEPRTALPPASSPSPSAPVADSVARRAGQVVGRAGRAVGRLAGPIGIAGELAGSPAGETAEEARDPAAADARAAALMGEHNRTMPLADDVVAPDAAPRTAPAAPARARVAGSARPPRRRSGDSESDDLNARSLRAIRGEASDGSARDENIRRRMAEAGRETYSSGGAIKSRDGLAIKGRTKAKFC